MGTKRFPHGSAICSSKGQQDLYERKNTCKLTFYLAVGGGREREGETGTGRGREREKHIVEIWIERVNAEVMCWVINVQVGSISLTLPLPCFFLP